MHDALVPNLVLQPLVENAFKHGVGATEAPGRLIVRARRAGDDVVLSVHDDGPGLADAAGDRRGVGLRNTIARLEQLYGARQRFSLRPAEGGGAIAEIVAAVPRRHGDAERMTATPPLRVVVVDDEPLGRQRIIDLLAAMGASEVVGTADSGPAAVETIRRLQPDLVFLDVQMPGMSGLEVARTLGDAMPPTVFVTAFDQHALKAFDLAALDYLVKPFDDERFEQAFRRAQHVRSLEDTKRLHERMLDLLHAAAPARDEPEVGGGESAKGDAWLERIAVESRGKVKFVPVTDVDYIAASGPYAEIVTGARRHLVREPMQELEERLDPSQFIRIHRSSIVRVDRIDTLLRGAGGDYEVQLKDGTRLRVSRSRRELLEQRLGMRG